MTEKEADEAQEWKGMQGSIAFKLIDRHADGWAEIGDLMEAWLRANGGKLERPGARQAPPFRAGRMSKVD